LAPDEALAPGVPGWTGQPGAYKLFLGSVINIVILSRKLAQGCAGEAAAGEMRAPTAADALWREQ
jgi:hypothetical protein